MKNKSGVNVPVADLAKRLLRSAAVMKHYEVCKWLVVGFLALPIGRLIPGALGADAGTNATLHHDRPFFYTNALIPDVPWSIHVARLERAYTELKFATTVGKNGALAMATVSEQLKSLPADLGQPLVAVNGDFYDKSENYQGRPRDLQIRQGELISNPAGHSCFWLDHNGNPQMTNVYSHLHVVWSDGQTTPFSLNGERAEEAAVLYTKVVGNSTRTAGGTELILDPAGNGAWLPIRVGETYEAKIVEVRHGGNSPIPTNRIVLSLGPLLAQHLPLKPGATLKILTETVPDLSGVDMAIGGGPALVRDGKPLEWKNFVLMRHPRTALGWNKTHYFLVVVDGRQSDLSVGMTFPELANYMLKLGCEDAMNFDGGGSATFWALGTVRNSPSEGQERPAANALAVLRKRATDQRN